MNRTPLRKKRPTPRRKAPERVTHVRAKPKAGAKPTAHERRHMDRVAALGCLICGGPATLHHVSASIDGGRIARSHRRVVPLAPEYHLIQHGPRTSVEALGHGGFYRTYGIDLLAVADALWAETEMMK